MAALYLDNDVSVHIAPELAILGHVAMTFRAQGLRGAGDPHQLLTAAQNRWIFLTHNYRDFLLLHQAWQLWRQAGPGYSLPEHTGILVAPQQRWSDAEAAQEIDSFLQTSPLMVNMMYQWTPSRGGRARQ